MRIRKLLLLATIIMLPMVAYAHTHLLKSVPAASSTGIAPETIVLEFSEATHLTALALKKDGSEQEQKLTPLPTYSAKTIQIAAPKLSPGAYVLEWRAVGDDTHVMSGNLRFTIAQK